MTGEKVGVCSSPQNCDTHPTPTVRLLPGVQASFWKQQGTREVLKWAGKAGG